MPEDFDDNEDTFNDDAQEAHEDHIDDYFNHDEDCCDDLEYLNLH